MIHCVRIDQHLHLYLYADYVCYSYWQYIIMFGILPIVLVFPVAFGISLDLMKEGFISSSTFLCASVFPYYAFWLLVKKRTVGLDRQDLSEDEKSCVSTILDMEEELFNTKKAFFRWPVLQLYRNFTVVILNTFILNPIYRTIFFIPVFGVYLFHDSQRKPYKHPYLNVLQCLSSGCLLVITACNIPASMIVMTNAMSVPLMGSVVTALQFVEMVTYAVVPISLVAWMIWERFCSSEKTNKMKSKSMDLLSQIGSQFSMAV